MRAYEILNEGMSGEQKQNLIRLFAINVSRAIPGKAFPGTSMAKRIMGNVGRDIFYLRNAAGAKQKYASQKVADILRPSIFGAAKAMANDHPDLIDFDVNKFARRVLDNISSDIDNLQKVLNMRANKLITERVSRSHPVIVVDVQPAYANTAQSVGSDSIVKELMQFLNNQTGSVIAYYNGAGEGFTEDEAFDVQQYFVERGLDENELHGIQFIEKTYGFFRSWMDNDIDIGLIINILRKMAQQKINDSRDLEPGLEELLYDDEYESWMEGDPLYFPDINVAQLKSMSGALLCGGARHECLKEIQLLMSVYNIRYKLAQDFIYG